MVEEGAMVGVHSCLCPGKGKASLAVGFSSAHIIYTLGRCGHLRISLTQEAGLLEAVLPQRMRTSYLILKLCLVIPEPHNVQICLLHRSGEFSVGWTVRLINCFLSPVSDLHCSTVIRHWGNEQ